MRYLLFLLLSITALFSQSCRKPNYTYHDPCSDSTFLAYQAREPYLTDAERVKFDAMIHDCEEYKRENASRGLLWPYILSAVAVVAAAVLIGVLLTPKPEDPTW